MKQQNKLFADLVDGMANEVYKNRYDKISHSQEPRHSFVYDDLTTSRPLSVVIIIFNSKSVKYLPW